MAAASKVSLRSRFPEIIAELGPRVEGALYEGAQDIAEKARQNILAKGLVGTGNMHNQTKASRAGQKRNQAQVKTAWYYHFAEFGTVHEPARPFMIPALEEAKPEVVAKVRIVLVEL